MTELKNTLVELKKISKLHNFNFMITRFDKRSKHVSDLDVLVKKTDFKKVVEGFVKNGYKTQSHDHALGGRFPGYQINLIKEERTKIDLHKDFTWRAKRYLDLDTVWSKTKLVDEFLVFISIIFEKTYIDLEDYKYIWSQKNLIFNKLDFKRQSEKYGWRKTFNMFKEWEPKSLKTPIFLPVYLVAVSYLEKFNFKSFLYYLFFRSRYFFTKQLPYD